MEPVGFSGIVKLNRQIVCINRYHFLCISYILFFRYAFLVALNPWQSLAHIIYLLYLQYYTNYSHGTIVPSPDLYTYDTDAQPQLFSLIASLLVFISFGLIVEPLLTFSVCRAVLNKSLDFKSSLLAVPRSALNLILTVLCGTGVLLAFFTAMVILMIMMVAGCSKIHINPATVVVIWSLVMVGACLYLSVAWSLANTVAILEEKRGWEAIKRSMYLVDGSKWVVFWLTVVLFGGYRISVQVSCILLNISDEMRFHDDGGAAVSRRRYGFSVVGLFEAMIIALFHMTSTVVLYLSCKSRFNEPLHTLIALSPQFGPQDQTSAEYMELDSTHNIIGSGVPFHV